MLMIVQMNTRLQVEHRVTDAVTGLDLGGLQLRVSAGELLSQEGVRLGAHAIERWAVAEDPHTHLPAPGTITGWRMPDPEGMTVDTGAEAATVMAPMYDSPLAKGVT
jgi:acetyl/propionyl-CoA carboxylase alpha subunit